MAYSSNWQWHKLDSKFLNSSSIVIVISLVRTCGPAVITGWKLRWTYHAYVQPQLKAHSACYATNRVFEAWEDSRNFLEGSISDY